MNPLILAGLMLQDDAVGGILALLFSGVGMVCWLIMIVLFIAGWWKTFEKAGQPGWAAIIPIYNIYILMEINGRPGWWVLLFFVPFINIVMPIIMGLDTAKSFGKDALYGILLLWIFMPIGFLILGFGDAEYIGPSAK